MPRRTHTGGAYQRAQRQIKDWSVQQKAVFDFVANGHGNGVVLSLAGSGKTTATVEAVWHTPHDSEVLVLAFNKVIQKELETRLPSWANARTYHSFGLRCISYGLGRPMIDDKKLESIIKELVPETKFFKLFGSIKKLVSLAKNYLTEDPEEILDLADEHGMTIWSEERFLQNINRYVLPALKLCRQRTNVVDFDDMCWLPAVLDIDVPRYDFIFVDEAQDTNKTQVLLLEKSLKEGGRLIAIGDEFQCQPPGTMVMQCRRNASGQVINWKPIEDMKPGDDIVTYDRHGAVLIQAGKVLRTNARSYSGNLIKVSAGGRETRCTPNHKWLVRWDRGASKAWAVYVMKKDWRFRIGYCQLINSQKSFNLAQRARAEKADAAWILQVFDDKVRAMAYEQLASAKYGLPQIVFTPSATVERDYLTQDVVDSIFDELGADLLFTRASSCLRDHGRMWEHPLYSKTDRKRQGRTTLFETQACNLIDGVMKVPTPGNKEFDRNVKWGPIRVGREFYDGKVYSLEIKKHHKYVADGLVTCNSIYGFRGASTNAIPDLIRKFKAKTMPLSVTYRCPKAVVRLANRIVPDLDAAPDAPEGIVAMWTYPKVFPSMKAGDMVLCRTMAPLVDPCFKLIERGVKAVIRGRDIGKGLVALIEKMDANGINDLFFRLAQHRDKMVQKYLARDKVAAAQAVIDNVEAIGSLSDGCDDIMTLLAKIRGVFSDDVRGVVFSTIHRAKGLEAGTIWLLRPDLLPHPMAKKHWEQQQERNIEYVAYTRAMNTLNIVNGPYPVPRKDLLTNNWGDNLNSAAFNEDAGVPGTPCDVEHVTVGDE